MTLDIFEIGGLEIFGGRLPATTLDGTLDANDQDIDNVGRLNYGAAAALEIGASVIIVTQTYHSIIVAGGTGNGDDDLGRALGGSEGDILILKANASGSGNIVTVIDGTGTNEFILAGGADFVMDSVDDRIMLIHNGTEWVELSRSSNS